MCGNEVCSNKRARNLPVLARSPRSGSFPLVQGCINDEASNEPTIPFGIKSMASDLFYLR